MQANHNKAFILISLEVHDIGVTFKYQTLEDDIFINVYISAVILMRTTKRWLYCIKNK